MLPSPPRPVVIDTDPGIDDALALMLALRSPELRVALITTVAGNVPVTTATANVQRLLALINPPQWPLVAQGAARPLRRPLCTALDVHGDDGLGGITTLRRREGQLRYPLPERPAPRRQATPHLLQLVDRHRRELTVIALGPLTNLARAIQRAPDTMQQLGRLVIMGGAINVPGNVTPGAEFNMFVDPHAAEIVFRAGIPITLVPLDVTRQVRLTNAFLAHAIRGAGTKLARAVRQMTRRFLEGAPATPGMAMHDPLAVAVALDPSLVQVQTLPVRVETQGQQTLGMTLADRRCPARWAPDTPRLDVALEVDVARVLALFAARVLTAPPQRHGRESHVAVVGSANIDYTVHASHLPHQGETVLGADLQTAYGGKGANQAVAAKRAGAQVLLVAKFGQDQVGRDYASYLRQEGINTAYLRWDPAHPSGTALIIVDRRGQNQIAVAPGANATLSPADLTGLKPLLLCSQVLVVQLETPLSTVAQALCLAKDAGVTTLLNPAPSQRLPPSIARTVDILVPNSVEAMALCGLPAKTPRQAGLAVRRLQRAGYRTVIVTLGKRGVVYTDAENVVFLPGLAVHATDTTAAGDTFVGYLACALAEGQALSEAVQLANAAAALAVTRSGAQPSIPWRHEVERFAARHKRSATFLPSLRGGPWP